MAAERSNGRYYATATIVVGWHSSVYPVRLSVCLSVSQSVSRQFSFPCDNFPTVSPFFTIIHMYIDIHWGKTPIESDVRPPKVKVTRSINRLVFAHFSSHELKAQVSYCHRSSSVCPSSSSVHTFQTSSPPKPLGQLLPT